MIDLNLLLGWLLKADPTMGLLVVAGIALTVIALVAIFVYRVIFGRSDVPHTRVVSIIKAGAKRASGRS